MELQGRVRLFGEHCDTLEVGFLPSVIDLFFEIAAHLRDNDIIVHRVKRDYLTSSFNSEIACDLLSELRFIEKGVLDLWNEVKDSNCRLWFLQETKAFVVGAMVVARWSTTNNTAVPDPDSDNITTWCHSSG